MWIASNILNVHDQPYRHGGLTQRITTYGGFAGHHPASSPYRGPKKHRWKGRRGRKQDVIKGQGGEEKKKKESKGYGVCPTISRTTERDDSYESTHNANGLSGYAKLSLRGREQIGRAIFINYTSRWPGLLCFQTAALLDDFVIY